MDKYTFKQTEKKSNKYTYEVTVDYAFYEEFENKAFAVESKHVKMPGFRPGHAPKHLVEKEIAGKVFSRALNDLLPTVASEIIVKENLNPMHELHYDLKEFDKDKGVVFTFELYAQPEVKLEDLKKLNVKYEEPKVTDEEVEKVIKNMVQNSLPEDASSSVSETDSESKKGKEKEEADFKVTDEMVLELNYDGAKTVDELKAKVKEAMSAINKQQYENVYANQVIEEALKLVDIELPGHLLEDEVARKEEEFRSRLSKIKLDVDGYLKTQGTTLEKQREEWEKEARAQVASDLLLINLAINEKLIPTEEEVQAEINKIENPKIQAQYKDKRNQDYLRTLMTRDKGLSKLIEVAKKH